MADGGGLKIFGTMGVLNVGEGDTKLTFDRDNPQEVLRASRIVKDMIRRGYALLVEVERDGVKKFERALDFNEETAEYIIADFDPVTAEKADEEEQAAAGEDTTGESPPTPKSKKGRMRRRAIDAGAVRAIGVARTAGG